MTREFFAADWLKRAARHVHGVAHGDRAADRSLRDRVRLAGRRPVAAARRPVWFLVVSYLNGVVIEIGRKTRAPADEEPGVDTYSALWGTSGAVGAWLWRSAVTAVAAWRRRDRIGTDAPMRRAAGDAGADVRRRRLVALRQPAARCGRGKWIEMMSGVWTLVMYLGLGAVPAGRGDVLAVAVSGMRFSTWRRRRSNRARGRQGRALGSRATRRLPDAGVVRSLAGGVLARASRRTCAALDIASRRVTRWRQRGHEHVSLIPAFSRELSSALAATRAPAGELVAVRSSAGDEDGAEHSFAGQLESFLNVPPARGLGSALRAVWRSGIQRAHSRVPPRARPAGAARAAGGAGAADGRAAMRRRRVQRRSGHRPPRRGGRQRRAGPRHRRSCRASATPTPGTSTAPARSSSARSRPSGACTSPIPGRPAESQRAERRPTRIEQPALGDDDVSGRRGAGAAAARHLRPAAGHRVGVRRRPARACCSRGRSRRSPPAPTPTARRVIWDNSNIAESYSGVTTPLTFSFAREIYEHVYRQFCRMMRVPEPRDRGTRTTLSGTCSGWCAAGSTTTC